MFNRPTPAIQVFSVNKEYYVISKKGEKTTIYMFVGDETCEVEELPKKAKLTKNIPENIEWVISCLQSTTVIFKLDDGTIRFGKPYTGPKISDEVEARMFPRHEIAYKQVKASKQSSTYDYLDDYRDSYPSKKKR